MKRISSLFVLTIFVAALPEFAAAQGRGGANKPPKPSQGVTQVKAQKPVRTSGATATTKKTKSPSGTTATTKKTKAPVSGTPVSGTTATTKKTKTGATAGAATGATGAPTGATGATGGPATGAPTPPAALPKNARLVERLQGLLPAGTDINDAASKFRNQGQFVAAVHVSNNLDIPFSDLKSRMIDDGMSLGQAIKKLRPEVDASQATAAATAQANTDLGTTATQGNSKRRSPR